jgi:TonB family protein
VPSVGQRAAHALIGLTLWSSALPLAPLAPHTPGAIFATPAQLQLNNLQQLDDADGALRRLIWQLHSAPALRSVTDSRGRDCAQDVDTYLLTAAQEARLQVLRAEVQQKSGAAATPALHQAALLLQQENYLASLVTNYWWLQTLRAKHEEILTALAARAPPDAAATAQRHTAAVAELLTRAYVAALAATTESQGSVITALKSSADQLFATYNQERGALAVIVSATERERGEKSVAQARDTPCPAAVTQTSGGPNPKTAGGTAASSVYPPASRAAYLEGSVVVLAHVSASGCMQHAAVFDSSGVPELDAAALVVARKTNFLPAERDHQAVEACFLFRVNFKLKD